MGTRTIYRVKDSEGKLVATLFSNSSHETEFAEDVFDALLKDPACAAGPNALVEKMLAATYTSESGNHRPGYRIFGLVPADEAIDGHREAIVTVTSAACITAESTPAWEKVRKVVS